ncbi:MAG: aminotransferase class V-fold PLP-dependent enzyme [Geminicoccaceae bacterium]|nr:aminotransferase class V-fold PLP-dependent enzyme [Geminicoccaceae bacterium]
MKAIRAEFPIFDAQGSPFHYLDNAATSQLCAPAAHALHAFETTARANVKRGVHKLADAATVAFDDARATMAAFVGAASPEEVIFTSGTTMSINMAARCLTPRLREGDEILLSELEHHSDIVPWQMAAQARGARVRAIPVTSDGRLDLEALPDLVGPRTRIVAVTHLSNVSGAVSDLSVIRAAAPEAIMLVDGAQRAAHGPIDVRAIGCDLYALSSHKMFGPTGAGMLWGRMDLLESLPPFLGGGEMIREVRIDGTRYADPPHRFEAGTPPIGAVLGMAAAARWLQSRDRRVLHDHEMRLTGRILDGLATLPGIRLVGPQGLQGRAGIVAFEVEDVHAHDVCQMLDGNGVALRGGHHCAQPLMRALGLVATARASLAPYNDDDDIDALIEGVGKVIERLR